MLLAAVLATAALLSTQHHTHLSGRSVDRMLPMPESVGPRESDPVMFSVPECEDLEVGDARACVQPDDGEWMFVISFRPYTAQEILECRSEDGGPTLPCIWTVRRNQQGGYNYFQ